MTAGPHRERSLSPQNAAPTGTIGVAIRYPMSVARLAGRSPPASLATMMPTWTSSRISRTPVAASRGTFIRWLMTVISSAYPASARPATMIVVETAPFTLDMLLRFVVTDAGPRGPLDRGFRLALLSPGRRTAWTRTRAPARDLHGRVRPHPARLLMPEPTPVARTQASHLSGKGGMP